MQQHITQLNRKVSDIKAKQSFEMKRAVIKVEESDFLLFRIKMVCRKTVSWVICAGMIGLFLLPGFLIYSISATDAYYKFKREYEVSLVLEEHQAFEKIYADIFKQSFQLDRVYYTKYLDPPFNNMPRPKPTFQSQNDFFKKFTNV